MEESLKFSEIVKKVTGFSTPIFGAFWNPSESERSVAKRIIVQLEDRRVLYNPSEMEVPDHCVLSVIDIRRMLSQELATLDENSPLAMFLRAMRAACQKFLDSVQADDRIVRYGAQPGHFASWEFNGAVGGASGYLRCLSRANCSTIRPRY